MAVHVTTQMMNFYLEGFTNWKQGNVRCGALRGRFGRGHPDFEAGVRGRICHEGGWEWG